MSTTPTQFRTIAERWRDHVAVSGIDKALLKQELALAILMFYAGFSAALDAGTEVAAFSDAEAVQLLQALQNEVKKLLGGGSH